MIPVDDDYSLAATMQSYAVTDIGDLELVPQVETAQFADEAALRRGRRTAARILGDDAFLFARDLRSDDERREKR